MLRSENRFADVEYPVEQWLGSRELLPRLVKHRQTFEGVGVVRMVTSHCLSEYAHRLTKTVLRQLGPMRLGVEVPHRFERLRQFCCFAGPLPNGQSVGKEGFGFVESTSRG